MSWLVVTCMLAQQPAPSPSGAWRVIDRPDVHLGVRPAAFLDNEGSPTPLEWGVGVTVQLTIHWPTRP